PDLHEARAVDLREPEDRLSALCGDPLLIPHRRCLYIAGQEREAPPDSLHELGPERREGVGAPPEDVVARQVEMHPGPVPLVVRTVWEVVLPDGQDEVAELVDAHREADLEIDVRAFVGEIGHNDRRVADEPDDLALEEPTLVVLVDAPRVEAALRDRWDDRVGADPLELLVPDLDDDEALARGHVRRDVHRVGPCGGSAEEA